MNNPRLDPEALRAMALRIHRRNGGTLTTFDLELPLLHPSLGIDSMDLAEIMVEYERASGVSPFDAAVPPRKWADLLDSTAGIR